MPNKSKINIIIFIYHDKGEIRFGGEYLYDHKRNGKKYIKGIFEYEGEYFIEKNGMENDLLKKVI